MVAFHPGDQHGGASFDEVTGAGSVQAGASDFDLAGGAQRGNGVTPGCYCLNTFKKLMIPYNFSLILKHLQCYMN